MKKHTPGPWTFVSSDSNGSFVCGDGYLIAKALIDQSGGRPPMSSEDAKSNARLIAAAPELLAFVQKIESVINRIRRNETNWDKVDHILTSLDNEAFDLLCKVEEE